MNAKKNKMFQNQTLACNNVVKEFYLLLRIKIDSFTFLFQSKLGVNEHHQAQVVNYMRFSRYQRGQRLRAVEMCFEELKSSR